MIQSQKRVSELKNGDTFAGCLLVRCGSVRQDSKGNSYLDMTLMDRSGEISALCWVRTAELPGDGEVVYVTGTLQWYNGRRQLKVESIQTVRADISVLETLVPVAPRASEEMLKEVDAAIESISSPQLKALVKETVEIAGRDRLLYFPAAMRVHHAERGGLLHHMTDMLHVAENFSNCYPYLNRDLLVSGVIVHDLAKITEMKSNISGIVSDYTKQGLLIGHLVQGVTLLHEAAERTGVHGEWLLLLEHMMISHHGTPEFGSPKPPMFPEAEVLRTIDDLDARLNVVKAVVDRTPAGSFSEKIQFLDGKRVYHPLYNEEKDPETEKT